MKTAATSSHRSPGPPANMGLEGGPPSPDSTGGLLDSLHRHGMLPEQSNQKPKETSLGEFVITICRRPPESPGSRAPLLSPRELEIARMTAEGLPNKTIASVLEISAHTVDTHLRRIFAKLGVGCRAALATKLAAMKLSGGNRA